MDAIGGIPDEIIEDILAVLPARDILACAASCNRIKHLVKNSSELQLVLKLAIYGYRLIPAWRSRTKNRTLQELLASFGDVRSRWEAFEYTHKLEIPVSRFDSQLIDGLLGVITEGKSLQFFRLGHSSTRLGDTRPWIEHQLLTSGHHKYCWDIGQDLLVLYSQSSSKIFLKTLSGDEPHPSASQPVKELDAELGSITVVGDNLIIHYNSFSTLANSVGGINWRTGQDVFVKNHRVVGRGFSVLTNDLIMVLVDEGNFSRPAAWLEVLSISNQSRRLQLRLPMSRHGWGYPIWSETASVPNGSSPTTYYSADNSADRISILSFEVGGKKFYVAISTHKVLHLLLGPTESDRELAWDEWGPASTRWFQGASVNYFSCFGSWLHFCYNMDQFMNANKFSPTQLSHAGVVSCDFNPRIIRHHQYLALSGTNNNLKMNGTSTELTKGIEKGKPKRKPNLIAQYIITEEWTIDSSVFAEVVHSQLPFRVFIKRGFDDWVQCPDMAIDPLATFTDNEKFDVYYFDDQNVGEM